MHMHAFSLSTCKCIANMYVHTDMKHMHANMIPDSYFVNTCFIFICLFDLQLVSQISQKLHILILLIILKKLKV